MKTYDVFIAWMEATFISMILFFWLIVVHSISQSEQLNVDTKWFYLPKGLICGAIWLDMMMVLTYIAIRQINDPSYYWQDNLGDFYTVMHRISLGLLLIYTAYFVFIAFVSCSEIQQMKKSYRFVIIVTLLVISISILSLFSNGFLSQATNCKALPNFNNTFNIAQGYLIIYALLNIYMYVISYLYCPAIDSIEEL